MSNPKKVGVTGGIGSGKSLVCKIFACLGVPVYNSDDRAKWLMNHDPVIRKLVTQQFGSQSYDKEGQLDRRYMASQVFDNQEKLTQLNQIVHPRVGIDFDNWCQDHAQHQYVIKEAALMFESGANKALNLVVNVCADTMLRVNRVLSRDSFRTKEEVLAIIDKQMSEEERKELSDRIIFNDNSQMVIPQVLALHAEFSE